MKKIFSILFLLLPLCVAAQFGVNMGGPIGEGSMSASGMGSIVANPMQMENPVTWSVEAEQEDASKVTISLKANIGEGWHLYSQYQNGIGMPMKLELEPNANFRPNNSLFWGESPKYIEEFEPILKTTERYLADEAIFTTSIIR